MVFMADRKAAGAKSHAGRVAAVEAEKARVAGITSRNEATMANYNAETPYRGALIDSQRGGLASTILNLGGAAGDPNNPFASQLVGTQAAAAPPTLESYDNPAASSGVASKLRDLLGNRKKVAPLV